MGTSLEENWDWEDDIIPESLFDRLSPVEIEVIYKQIKMKEQEPISLPKNENTTSVSFKDMRIGEIRNRCMNILRMDNLYENDSIDISDILDIMDNNTTDGELETSMDIIRRIEDVQAQKAIAKTIGRTNNIANSGTTTASGKGYPIAEGITFTTTAKQVSDSKGIWTQLEEREGAKKAMPTETEVRLEYEKGKMSYSDYVKQSASIKASDRYSSKKPSPKQAASKQVVTDKYGNGIDPYGFIAIDPINIQKQKIELNKSEEVYLNYNELAAELAEKELFALHGHYDEVLMVKQWTELCENYKKIILKHERNEG